MHFDVIRNAGELDQDNFIDCSLPRGILAVLDVTSNLQITAVQAGAEREDCSGGYVFMRGIFEENSIAALPTLVFNTQQQPQIALRKSPVRAHWVAQPKSGRTSRPKIIQFIEKNSPRIRLNTTRLILARKQGAFEHFNR